MEEVKHTLENAAYAEVSRLTLRLKESERKVARLDAVRRELIAELEAEEWVKIEEAGDEFIGCTSCYCSKKNGHAQYCTKGKALAHARELDQ